MTLRRREKRIQAPTALGLATFVILALALVLFVRSGDALWLVFAVLAVVLVWLSFGVVLLLRRRSKVKGS